MAKINNTDKVRGIRADGKPSFVFPGEDWQRMVQNMTLAETLAGYYAETLTVHVYDRKDNFRFEFGL